MLRRSDEEEEPELPPDGEDDDEGDDEEVEAELEAMAEGPASPDKLASSTGELSVKRVSKSFFRNKKERASAVEEESSNTEIKIDFLKAVIRLQRAYRLSSYVYRHFGPELFVDSRGRSSSAHAPALARQPERPLGRPSARGGGEQKHARAVASAGGRVMFEGVQKPAQWMNVAATTSVPRLVRFMDHFWKMSKPEVLTAAAACTAIPKTSTTTPSRLLHRSSSQSREARRTSSSPRSCRSPSTGGWSPRRSRRRRGSSPRAATRECEPRLRTTLGPARARPARQRHAPPARHRTTTPVGRRGVTTVHPRVVSRMRLVGDAMNRYHVQLPVVGVFPWGVVNERWALEMGVGGRVTQYRPTPATVEGAPLNPHHTHFIFVDNGTEGKAAWGSEIEIRSKLEHAISKSKKIPIVQLARRAASNAPQAIPRRVVLSPRRPVLPRGTRSCRAAPARWPPSSRPPWRASPSWC